MTVLLYNQSCYSLLESTIRINSLVEHALNNGNKAIALTDNNLYAAMGFYRYCISKSIKPIIGLKVSASIDDSKYDFVVYAVNNNGYQHLMKLSSYLSTDRNEVSFNQLMALDDSCCIVIPANSYLNHLYYDNQKDKIDEFISRLPDNFYLGISDNKSQSNIQYYNFLKPIADKYGKKMLAFGISLYNDISEYESYSVLQAIKNNTTVTDNRLVFNKNAYLKNNDEFIKEYDNTLIRNNDEFSEKINIDLQEFKTDLPDFITPNNVDRKDYLKSLCVAGLKKRLNDNVTSIYSKRLQYELDVICSMNFENYFLIIWDLILFSRKQNIQVGVGRGSAVGSLVSYCLGITHIDPIKYNLLFERFLNPERISMPDIDIDFPDDRREEVIQYVRKKYGEDHVAHIITFSTLASRQVIRDVGKALNTTASAIEMVSKNITSSKESLQSIYLNNRNFRQVIDSSDGCRKLFEIACKLEGLPRNTSTHAGGIVLSSKPLTDVIPVTNISGSSSTQYPMEFLEDMGLIKIDFLGLRNLSTIAEICQSVKDINIMKIDLDDKKVYQLLSKGDTAGIFQLESNGIRNLLRRYKPEKFEDICVILSLYRPGPMDNINQFLANKENPSSIHYICDDLKPILNETYGVIVYQEQIMQISSKIAGFSLGKADILRKAISKKNSDMMQKMKNEFISGAIENGYSGKIAEEIYQLIEKFASYGFNKSHAMAYGLTAYQLAYLKANYPGNFYASILNGVIGNKEKISEYIIEARKFGMNLLAADINYSDVRFTIENGNIRFPLSAIAGISNMTAYQLINERENNGLYKNYFDFYVRANSISVNDKIIEALIRSGALDSFKLTHNTMLEGMDECRRYAELCRIENNGQISFDLNLVTEPLLKNIADNPSEKANDELEYLGLYLKEHPIAKLRKQFNDVNITSQFKQINGYQKLILMVNTMREHKTKTGEVMCFVGCNDEFGNLDITFMPKQYTKYKYMLKKGIIILVEGTNDGRDSLKVNSIKLLQE